MVSSISIGINFHGITVNREIFAPFGTIWYQMFVLPTTFDSVDRLNKINKYRCSTNIDETRVSLIPLRT